MSVGMTRVEANLVDLSAFVDAIPRGWVTMVVQSERGPMFKARRVASEEERERDYGLTVPYSTDPLVCKRALELGARLILIRVAHCTDPANPATLTARSASVDLLDRGATPIPGMIESAAGPFSLMQALSGRTTGTEVGPFSFGAGTADAVKIRVGNGSPQIVTMTGSMQSTERSVDQLNAGTNGLTASVRNNRLHVEANDPAASLEIMPIANDAYSVLGLTEGTYAAVAGFQTLVLSIDSGEDQSLTLTPANGEVGAFSLTAGQVANQLLGLEGAVVTASNGRFRIRSSTTGPNSTVQVKSGTARTALGLDGDVHSGANGSTQPTLRFPARNEGTWGDDLAIIIRPSELNPDTLFNVAIRYKRQSGMNENHADMSMDPESPRYVATYISQRSRLVYCDDLHSTNADTRPALLDLGVYLSGGNDGLEGFNDADWIGDEFAQTGMYAANQDRASIYLMMPGSSSMPVIQAMSAYNARRKDLLTPVQMPGGLDPQDAIDWRMGNGVYSHEPLNDFRTTLWYGRPTTYESRTDSRVEISCLGHLAACLTKTDAREWGKAPVGPRRGVTNYVLGLDFNMADYPAYRDAFADYQINYLMINRDEGIEGAVFWEQNTTQRAATSLQYFNVVVFCTYALKQLMPALRLFLDEPNHPETWREFDRTIRPVFELWKDEGRIYDFAVETDRDAYFDNGVLKNAVINTGLEIDQGIYNARCFVQTVKPIKLLQFDMGLVRTGTAFSEYTELKELPGWVRR